MGGRYGLTVITIVKAYFFVLYAYIGRTVPDYLKMRTISNISLTITSKSCSIYFPISLFSDSFRVLRALSHNMLKITPSQCRTKSEFNYSNIVVYCPMKTFISALLKLFYYTGHVFPLINFKICL